jgi:hypothetical protein
MNTKDLAAELEAIRESIVGLSAEHEAKVMRAAALSRELEAIAPTGVGPDHEKWARAVLSPMTRDGGGPAWQLDARTKALKAFRSWLISAELLQEGATAGWL